MTLDPELLTGLGAAMAVFLSATGAAIASAHSGIFAIRSHTFKNFVPIVQAGVLAIYGLIIGVLLCGKFQNNDDAAQEPMTAVDGYRNLSAGLAVGLACWASGYGMASFIRQCNEGKHNLMVATNNKPAVTGGATGDREPLLNDNTNNNNEGTVTEPDFVKLVFVMIFLESIGLYGLIVSLFLMG